MIVINLKSREVFKIAAQVKSSSSFDDQDLTRVGQEIYHAFILPTKNLNI